MPSYRLVAKVDSDPAPETHLVRSPAVGVVDGVPNRGVYLNPSEGFLTLRVLNRRYVVQLPRDVQGRVTELFIEDTATPVDYRQPLFRLSLAEGQLAADGAGEVARAAPTEGTAVEAEMIPVPAPSEGVFYRRPSPESPAYVEEGGQVTTGSVLGLVEVMKSFNQITYGGPGLPERGIVARILVEDAQEVAFGQTLFLIRPS